MIRILVTGAKGQLGNDLKIRSSAYPSIHFDFIDLDELDLTNSTEVQKYFKKHSYHYCINCAAFTAVDQAENNRETAFKVNAEAVENLVKAIHPRKTRLIHISTDYVFDGLADKPYKETDQVNPRSVYGHSKLAGEKKAIEYSNSLIIRTSWLYSLHGHNFLKTILKKGKEQSELKVVNDQTGSPTWAGHLADAILWIIDSVEKGRALYQPGIYHFANEGSCSWYNFALAIKEASNLPCEIVPVPTSAYPLPAKRPVYSILDKSKIRNTYHVAVPNWEEGLNECFKRMQT